MDIIKRVQKYLKYMYVRYLLATELYMVETWEQMVVHGLIAVLFIAFGFFNYALMNRHNSIQESPQIADL